MPGIKTRYALLVASVNPITALLQRALRRLRYPYLFVVLAVLFLLDLVVPDAIPFVDELVLGLLTMLVGSWRNRREPPPTEQ